MTPLRQKKIQFKKTLSTHIYKYKIQVLKVLKHFHKNNHTYIQVL